MNKLIVAGCSFSDYSKVNRVYGEFLADKLGFGYIHQGSGCGSNYRIWRVIGNLIKDGTITDKDLLIIQYTSLERREFWSHREGSIDVDKTVNLNEQYQHGGSLLKYKSYSSQWQKYQEEKDFLNLFETYFSSTEYESDWFVLMNMFFQSFLLKFNIKTIFLETMYMNDLPRYGMLDEFKPFYLNWKKNLEDPTIHLEPHKDYGHLNELGHQLLAHDLFEHIQKCGIVNP